MFTKLKAALFSGTSKDAIISLSGNGVVAIAGTLFSVLVARSLAPERFGLFSALYALATILSSLGDVGISSALVNFLPKIKADRHLIISLAFWAQTVIGFLLFLIVVGLIPFHSTLIPGSRPEHFLYLGALAFILSLEIFSIATFRAEKKFLHSSLVMTIDSWVKLTLVFILFNSQQLNIRTIFLSAIASSLIATAYGLSHELKNIHFVFPKKQASQVFQFAKWIALSQVFSVFISRIDTLLLNAMKGGFEAGIFAAASRVSLLFVLLVSSLGSVVSPRFSSFNTKDQVKQYLNKLIPLTSLVALVMASTALLAPYIINIVFGPEYSLSIPVFQALTLAMIPFLFTITTVNPLIYTFNRPDFIAKITILQVVSITILDIILIPIFGTIAPTLSLAISNLISLALTGIKLYQLTK